MSTKTAKKKTARKKTGKTTGTKKTGKKTATRKTTALKTAAAATGADGLARACREKAALLDRMGTLGLLDQESAAQLAEQLEDLGGERGGWPMTAGWDKALTRALGEVDGARPDAAARTKLQALLVWQESLSHLPETADGLRTAVEGLRKIVAYHGATLFLRHPEKEFIRPLLSVGLDIELIGRVRFSGGSGFSSWVASKGKPVLYGSLHRNVAPGEDQIRSFLAVPLNVSGNCLGVLQLGHNQDSTYDQSSLRLVMLAGSMLAGLVQRFIARAQIEHREIRNPATGLATARYLRSRLDEEVVRCRELGHAMSLAVIELEGLEDHVRQFGDEFARRCHQELAEVVAGWCEPTELAGHAAGDRMIVLLPGARREKAAERSRELMELVKRHNFPRRKKLSVSVGVATYPADAEESQALLEFADNALGARTPTQMGSAEAARSLAA